MTKNKYKRKLKKLFFYSIKNDLNKWIKTNGVDFQSPMYNRVVFSTDINTSFSKLKTTIIDLNNYNNQQTETICKYSLWYIPIDIKVWLYIMKIKNKFRKDEKIRKLEKENSTLKITIENVEQCFMKEIRKEKLKKIQK